MNETKKIAILLGASGLVGGFLLSRLLDSEAYSQVVVFARKDLPRQHPKLTTHVIDFKHIENYAHLLKGDDLFCCLGTTIAQAITKEAFYEVDYTYPVRFAQLAKDCGVKHYLLVSSMGANSKSKVFYMRTKGEVERAIERVDLSHLSIFRPASLLGNREHFRLKEKLTLPVLQALSFLFVGGLRKYKGIHASKVADAMYRVAQEPHEGVKIYESHQMQ